MNKTIIVTLISTVLMTTGCVSQKTFDKDMGLERQINQQLLNEVNADEVKIVKMRDRLRITVKDEIFFPEGVAEVSKEGKSILDKLVPTLQKAISPSLSSHLPEEKAGNLPYKNIPDAKYCLMK